ncbi:MAG: 1-acyl-sn-glycerol-3-phosphate acyltransferase [Lachnospiraceae bacterium]|nr:1-acyl-sn-glycerol-3-phosphate acyltransferase [Lachnospiraceae bacterium]
MIRLILALTFVVIFLLISLILIPLGYLIGLFSMDARDRYAQRMISWAFKVVGIICGAHIEVRGKELVPDDEPVLFVANHRSIFDIVLLYAEMFRPTAIVSKKEIAAIPILNWWMILLHCRFMDRKDLKQSLKVILGCIEDAKKGISMMIYPEGTRTTGASELDMLPFKDGSFKIATKSGIKIVPVALHGTRAIFEEQFPLMRSGRVVISFGAPIDPASLDKEGLKHLAHDCQEEVKKLLEQSI